MKRDVLLGVLVTICVGALLLISFSISNQNGPTWKSVQRFFARSSITDIPLILRPFSVSKECLTNGTRVCSAAAKGLGQVATYYSSEDVCADRFRRTCRIQPDGECGWDVDEERRVERCIQRQEWANVFDF